VFKRRHKEKNVMEIEIRLKKILREHGLDHHGVTQRIARDLEVHRHTIGRLYRNQMANPSLKVLGDLCDWLEARGVPAEKLPKELLGSRPRGLWRAVAAGGVVRIYLGEYQQMQREAPVMLWISRRDATVQDGIVRVLSTPSTVGEVRPTVMVEYVPFRFVSLGSYVKRQFEEDLARSKDVFDKMRSKERRASSILIGSQRVNYLVELFVADLFGCKPFQPIRKGIKVPFYLTYHSRDRAVPSCFGGLRPPPGKKGTLDPGIHHLDKNGKWVYCPWTSRKEDAGVIIEVYDPGTERVELAVFGFSGWGTEALGRQLLRDPKPFWPPYYTWKCKQLGIYVCRFGMEATVLPDAGEVIHANDLKIERIDGRILQRYLP
jgi:transcriptional regulator with XRE-family HTH domain